MNYKEPFCDEKLLPLAEKGDMSVTLAVWPKRIEYLRKNGFEVTEHALSHDGKRIIVTVSWENALILETMADNLRRIAISALKTKKS